MVKKVNMLAKHPEAAAEASVDETFDVAQFAAAFALLFFHFDHVFPLNLTFVTRTAIIAQRIVITEHIFFHRLFIGHY